MRTKTPVELLEDLAYESESVSAKARLAVVIAHIRNLEQQRIELRYRQIAVLQGIKLLAADNARIVFECDQALRELGVG